MAFAALRRLGGSVVASLAPTPSSSPPPPDDFSDDDGKPKKVTKQTLFPLVTKEDEEADAAAAAACNHDCNACPTGYGRAFDKIGVDTKDDVWGKVVRYSSHAIVATGQTDWIRDVEEIKDSVMQALAKHWKSVNDGRLMISASDLPPPDDYYTAKPQPTTVVLVPEFIVLENVTPADAPTIIADYVNQGPTTETPLLAPASSSPPPCVATQLSSVTEQLSAITITPPKRTLQAHPYPHDFIVLICSHRHRDARCGISAPILRREFERQLRPLGLWRDHTDHRPGGANVVFINHVGGHKYAANVIIYRKSDGQGLWLARVSPQHVASIVKHTLVEGKVVDPEMVRGGFNRKKGITSW